MVLQLHILEIYMKLVLVYCVVLEQLSLIFGLSFVTRVCMIQESTSR